MGALPVSKKESNMTSHVHCFVGGLSKKKADVYYSLGYWDPMFPRILCYFLFCFNRNKLLISFFLVGKVICLFVCLYCVGVLLVCSFKTLKEDFPVKVTLIYVLQIQNFKTSLSGFKI